ncbi:MAG TPA: hypothetical protein PKX87_02605, partial [Alphaproteobacteria bacterium]|nr:hypothetical protein [Alphaproteobacteria bacterium]
MTAGENGKGQKTSGRLVESRLWMACLTVFVCFGLSSCSLDREIHRKIETDQKQTVQALRALEPTAEKPTSLMVDERPWYG